MKSKRKRAKHSFRIRVEGLDGKPQEIISWAKVIDAKQAVDLDLTAAHVKRSIELKGIGNTRTCAMAVCTNQQSAKFPHKVTGDVDWQYARAYIVTKTKNGLPIECVRYTHGDEIAKLNDTKGGQRKLLEDLQKNGDRVIHLAIPTKQKWNPKYRPQGNRDGTRSPKTLFNLRGGKLRHAVATLGGAV